MLTETYGKKENALLETRVNGMKMLEDEWIDNDQKLDQMYQTHHPQICTSFEEEIKEYWPEIGRL